MGEGRGSAPLRSLTSCSVLSLLPATSLLAPQPAAPSACLAAPGAALDAPTEGPPLPPCTAAVCHQPAGRGCVHVRRRRAPAGGQPAGSWFPEIACWWCCLYPHPTQGREAPLTCPRAEKDGIALPTLPPPHQSCGAGFPCMASGYALHRCGWNTHAHTQTNTHSSRLLTPHNERSAWSPTWPRCCQTPHQACAAWRCGRWCRPCAACRCEGVWTRQRHCCSMIELVCCADLHPLVR